MTTELQQHTENQESALTTSVLRTIERTHVKQLPRWQFTAGEYALWLLWALSVCIGALAFSVIIFFSIHAQYAPIEATHERSFQFFLEVMPYAWVLVFVVMAGLSHYNLRHTKRGYKFAVWQILLSSIVVSFMGGMVLHTAGVGFKVDNIIATHFPILPAFQTLEARMWQSPAEGRMLGMFTATTAEPHIVAFTDAKGEVWKLNTQELNPLDMEMLFDAHKVRILGISATTSSSTDGYFYGCGVLPFITHNESWLELRSQRERFVERMEDHYKKVATFIGEFGTSTPLLPQNRCASHTAVLRLHRK